MYAQLAQLPISDETKQLLDCKIIQFGCACISRAEEAEISVVAEGMEKIFVKMDTSEDGVELDEPMSPIFHLNTGVLASFNSKKVREWLQTDIYPHLRHLELPGGFDMARLGDLRRCTALTTLSARLYATGIEVQEPLEEVEDVDGLAKSLDQMSVGPRVCSFTPQLAFVTGKRVQPLCTLFPKLWKLTLHDGELLGDSLNGLSVSTLILRNIGGEVDLSGCRQLQKCELVHVSIKTDSLSWVVSSRALEELVIENPLTPVGRLALNKHPLGQSRLQSLSIRIQNIDEDLGLLASLPWLLDSNETLTSLNLFTYSKESLLRTLLKSEKGRYLQCLGIQVNQHEDVSQLANFVNLRSVTFGAHVDRVYEIGHHNFSANHLLKDARIIDSEGFVTTIPLNRVQNGRDHANSGH
jgi:hypothetical protein